MCVHDRACPCGVWHMLVGHPSAETAPGKAVAWGTSPVVAVRPGRGGQGAGMCCVSGSESQPARSASGGAGGGGGGRVVLVVCAAGARMLVPGARVSLCTNPRRLIRPQDRALKTRPALPRRRRPPPC